MRANAARMWYSTRSALRGEDETDCADEAVPGGELLTQGASSGGGEPIILCAPAVLGNAPLRVDPAALLQPDQRRVDGALAYLQRILRELLDAVGESPSVHRRQRECLEDEQVERALQDLFISGLGHGFLPNDQRKVASLLPNVKRTEIHGRPHSRRRTERQVLARAPVLSVTFNDFLVFAE